MDIPDSIKDLRNLEIIRKKRIWKPFMEKYGCQTICELGVFQGENFERMIEHNPQAAVAVDAWIDDGTTSRNDMGFSQDTLDKQYSDFVAKMSDKPFVQIYRKYTSETVKYFPDNFFDLIYVDADHAYEGCLADIKDWYPKVKNGKFLIGDDYRNAVAHRTGIKFGVIEAVQKFASKNDLTIYELPRYGWVIIK